MTENERLLMQRAYDEVKKYKKSVESDPYRLQYHLMPPVGFLNDPNGLIHYKGMYHVFYQWNPFATEHGAKFWGHYTSTDMIHWKEEPAALAPSEWYDKNGCYSGSAVESDGKLYLFYTGNVKREDGTRETYQCLAVSSDGIHFEKKGPVLHLQKGYTAHFRDPKVWKKADRWYMVVGAQTLSEKGAAVLFSSKDLYHWKEMGVIAGADVNGLGEFGYMWECPDLIHLSGKDILLVSPQGLEPKGHQYHNLYQSGYLIGELEYEPLHYQHGPFTELDRGFDFYAPQTFIDEKGRTILYGWMGITDETESYQPTIKHHWIHALTMPRELTYQNGKLYQKPLEEYKQLRNHAVNMQVRTEGDKLQLDQVKGKAMELVLQEMEVEGERFVITFRDEATLLYETSKNEISLQRTNLKTGSIEIRTCQIEELSKLHIFMDQSSLEIFINDGEEVFTLRYFPSVEDKSVVFEGRGSWRLEKWEI